ncbi:MAG: hypothetical protein EA360_11270, partial [Balneolaceae bacterium]
MRLLQFLLFGMLLLPASLSSQTLPVGSLPDQQMRLQALLSDSSSFSVVNRPFSFSEYNAVLNNSHPDGWWNRNYAPRPLLSFGDTEAGLLPVSTLFTLNSRHPLSENNGAAWYGRGWNREFSGGFFARGSFFSLSVQPHLVIHENRDFPAPGFVLSRSGPGFFQTEEYAAEVDLPYRFGPDPFTVLDPGHSSARLFYRAMETGLSTEPLWWGPAVKYPLMMSNNAPGISHFFLGTRHPAPVPLIGHISFRWILGYPQDSDYYIGFNQKDRRFMNGANVAWNPSFIPELSLGVTRMFHVYEVDGFSLSNAALILGPVRKVRLIRLEGSDEERQERNQMISAYAHLRLPGARAEIYGEFFREDHSFDLRDFLQQPHHNSGYAIGLQKIMSGPGADFYNLNVEFTNLTTSQLQQVRPQAYFYSHSRIQQGHTNRGQVLGAAIGPGSNSQYVELQAYRERLRVGLFLQRVVNNDNFHFLKGSARLSPHREFGDFYRHRVDLNSGFSVLMVYDSLVFTGKLVWNRAYNYGRYDLADYEGSNVTNYER